MNKEDYERKIKGLQGLGKIEGVDYKVSSDNKGNHSITLLAGDQETPKEAPSFSERHPYLVI